MKVEVEAKLQVQGFEQLEQRLQHQGRFVTTVQQRDVYFDDAQNSLLANDRGLRLRREQMQQHLRWLMTYKGAKMAGRFKRRQEFETEVTDGKAIEAILQQLGFAPLLVVEKLRRIWHFGGCEVMLDQVEGLGCFVEIEGENEQQVEKAQQQLGLTDYEHVPFGYAELLRQKRSTDK